jgi:hypothetical protein
MFPFVKRIQQSGSKHHRLDEKLTLNQFFEEHYFLHAEASKRQPHPTRFSRAVSPNSLQC